MHWRYELRKQVISECMQQWLIDVRYDGVVVGQYVADLVG